MTANISAVGILNKYKDDSKLVYCEVTQRNLPDCDNIPPFMIEATALQCMMTQVSIKQDVPLCTTNPVTAGPMRSVACWPGTT